MTSPRYSPFARSARSRGGGFEGSAAAGADNVNPARARADQNRRKEFTTGAPELFEINIDLSGTRVNTLTSAGNGLGLGLVESDLKKVGSGQDKP